MLHQTKHLSLVESTVADAYCKLESTYGAAKGTALTYTPDFVAKAVAQIEKICQPVLSFGQKGASNMLVYADSTVCSSYVCGAVDCNLRPCTMKARATHNNDCLQTVSDSFLCIHFFLSAMTFSSVSQGFSAN
jgi:hypothetical protein